RLPQAASLPRAELALLGALGLALLSAYTLVRSDPRYAAPLLVLLTPPLAAAAAAWTRGGPRRLRGLALALTLLGVTIGWRPPRHEKTSYRLAGETLRTWGARRVLAHDSRGAYYADAE
ncbi:MAG TPA: hypothetical protein DEA08_14505, partial [Planctomycetes bacterium]|nr:hypothetical protein [Planctomycetota bacterium]